MEQKERKRRGERVGALLIGASAKGGVASLSADEGLRRIEALIDQREVRTLTAQQRREFLEELIQLFNRIELEKMEERPLYLSAALLILGLSLNRSRSECYQEFHHSEWSEEEASAFDYAWTLYHQGHRGVEEIDRIHFSDYGRDGVALHHQNRLLQLHNYHHLFDYIGRAHRLMLGRSSPASLSIKGATLVEITQQRMLYTNWREWLLLKLVKHPTAYHTVTFQTLFDDGRAIITTNFPNSEDHDPALLYESYAQRTSYRNLEKRHDERVRGYLLEHKKSALIRLEDEKRAIEVWHEMRRRNNRYRQSIHYVSDGELKRLLGKRYLELSPLIRRKIILLEELYRGYYQFLGAREEGRGKEVQQSEENLGRIILP